MKRFLLLFCTVVLVCSIMVVPAFASETIRAHYSEDHFESFTNFTSLIPAGEYKVTFYVPELDRTFDLGSHDFIIEPYYLNCAPDDPLKDAVIMHFEYSMDDSDFVCDFVWNPSDGVYSLVENDEFISYALAYIDDIDYLDVVVELTPVAPVPVKETFLESVGTFFTQSIAWLGTIAGVVTNSPALLVIVIGMIIAGVIIGYLKRVKNM